MCWSATLARYLHRPAESLRPEAIPRPVRYEHWVGLAMDQEMLEEASDASLVVAIGRWRQEALAEVYRRHSGSVLALSLHLLRNRALAEDVAQEVFVRLWRYPDKFDAERGSLRSYLLAQTHGRAVDMLRSEESRRRRESREAAWTFVTELSPESEVEGLAVDEEVRRAVRELPDSERQAIILAYFGGKTYRQVAQVLGVPEGTIKSRIRAGLQRLRLGLADVRGNS
jgi:RNA polymerase sigma-70 factor, ECF subfamily